MFETGHAVSMVADCGAEVLVHVGLETVGLQGKGFTVHAQNGQKVKKGDLLIWFLQTFDTRLNVVADSADSLLALIGQLIAPVFRPLGFADWRMVTALISGFTAKEAVVSTLAVLLGTNVANLSSALGSVFNPITAVSFLVFTLLYTPCVAAVATIRRELGSAVKTIGVVIMQCSVAWLTAFVIYNVIRVIL